MVVDHIITNKLYYMLCGIIPLDIRRQVIAEEERNECNYNEKHYLYAYIPENSTVSSDTVFYTVLQGP